MTPLSIVDTIGQWSWGLEDPSLPSSWYDLTSQRTLFLLLWFRVKQRGREFGGSQEAEDAATLAEELCSLGL